MWIARDKNGDVYLYEAKPIRGPMYFCTCVEHRGTMYLGNEEIYPELTYENSPREIKITLPTTGADRGRRDSIIRGLKQLEKDYMLSYEEEIEWLNKLVN